MCRLVPVGYYKQEFDIEGAQLTNDTRRPVHDRRASHALPDADDPARPHGTGAAPQRFARTASRPPHGLAQTARIRRAQAAGTDRDGTPGSYDAALRGPHGTNGLCVPVIASPTARATRTRRHPRPPETGGASALAAIPSAAGSGHAAQHARHAGHETPSDPHNPYARPFFPKPARIQPASRAR